jgi:hypothetical protein
MKLHLPLQQRFGGSTQHRLDHFDARVRTLGAEALQAFEQQPDRIGNVHRQADFSLPSGGQLLRGALGGFGLVDQGARAAVEEFAGRRQHGLAALHLEGLHAELGLELLDCIGHRRLALLQSLGGFLITT